MYFEDLKYLALSGGAKQGTIFVGALDVLQCFLHMMYNKCLLQQFDGFIGTSVGALVTLHILCGDQTHRIHELVQCSLSCLQQKTNAFIDDVLRLSFGDVNISFAQFCNRVNKHLKVCACELNTLQLKVFGDDETPNTSVASAIKASIAIPMLFDKVEIDGKCYVDGGCQLNLPIGIYPASQTLALWLRSTPELVSTPSLHNPLNLLVRVVELFFHAQDSVARCVHTNKHVVGFDCESAMKTLNVCIDERELREKGCKRMLLHLLQQDRANAVRFCLQLFATCSDSQDPGAERKNV